MLVTYSNVYELLHAVCKNEAQILLPAAGYFMSIADDKSVEVLESLAKNTSLRYLSMENVALFHKELRLTPESDRVTLISDAFKANTNLCTLHMPQLNNNGTSMAANILHVNTSLKSLVLTHCSSDNIGMNNNRIISALQQNVTLTSLDMRHVGISAAVGHTLVEMVGSNELKLTALHLFTISHDQMYENLSQNTSLTAFSCESYFNKYFDKDSMVRLLLRNHTLELLNVEHTSHIDVSHRDTLRRALHLNTSLVSLTLDRWSGDFEEALAANRSSSVFAKKTTLLRWHSIKSLFK